MTDPLFRNAPYQREAAATVLAINASGGIILDRSLFYPTSGGQPGDSGTLTSPSGTCPIVTTVYDQNCTTIVLVTPDEAPRPSPGETVTLSLDWDRRHALMRMHTALHLLCSLIPFPVTGGQIGDGDGRLDFDIEDSGALDKDDLTKHLNALVAADHPVTTSWISDAELEANPDLVRTMAVKPPMGTGKARLFEIGANGEIDSQPCGGTHVRSTAEIGQIAVTKIEKKGRRNRRVRVTFT